MKDLKEKIEEYISSKWLRRQIDIDTGLQIFDYTNETTFTHHWDEITSNHRSCIRDKDYNLILPGMSKFFNFHQNSPEKQKEIIDWMKDSKNYIVTKKYDGCLASAFPYEGRLIYTSKCTFSNYVVEAAKRILKDKLFINQLEDISTGLVFEVICPETRQIVNYGNLEEVRVITSFDMENHTEKTWEETKNICKILGLKTVEEVNMSYEELKNWIKTHDFTEEGFVVRKIDTNERVKFKSEDYLNVSAIKCYLDEKHLVRILIDYYSNLKHGEEIKDFYSVLLERIKEMPDEIQSEAVQIADKIKEKYIIIDNDIKQEYKNTLNMTNKEIGINRNLKYKYFIFDLRNNKPIYKGIIKRLFDNIE